MKEYNADDLARCGGEDGGTTLIAAHGKVYDVTASKRWRNGRHMNRHQAGRDLTAELKAAPHGPEVLGRFPEIGDYREAPAEVPSGSRGTVERWLKDHPFWRRHPHPAAAHGPVGMIIPVFVFEILGLASGSTAMEFAAFLCLVLVLLSLPVTMATGYITWWVNFECARTDTILWKQRLALVALVLSAGAVWLRTTISSPIDLSSPAVLVYIAIIVVLTAIIVAIGYLGGTLVFPYE